MGQVNVRTEEYRYSIVFDKASIRYLIYFLGDAALDENQHTAPL